MCPKWVSLKACTCEINIMIRFSPWNHFWYTFNNFNNNSDDDLVLPLHFGIHDHGNSGTMFFNTSLWINLQFWLYNLFVVARSSSFIDNSVFRTQALPVFHHFDMWIYCVDDFTKLFIDLTKDVKMMRFRLHHINKPDCLLWYTTYLFNHWFYTSPLSR